MKEQPESYLRYYENTKSDNGFISLESFFSFHYWYFHAAQEPANEGSVRFSEATKSNQASKSKPFVEILLTGADNNFRYV